MVSYILVFSFLGEDGKTKDWRHYGTTSLNIFSGVVTLYNTKRTSSVL